MPHHLARLVIVPELVTDHRWLASIAVAWPAAIVVAIPDPQPNESLPALAERCLAQLQATVLSSTASEGKPAQAWMAMGVGWGGPLATEIALAAWRRQQGPQACLLIGSCRTRESLPRSLRWQASLAARLPSHFLRRWAIRRWLGWFPEANSLPLEMRELVRSAREHPLMARLPWAIQAMLQWKLTRSELSQSPLRVHQLHGRLDGLLPRPSVDDATLLLQAGHLLHLSHPEELARWLDAILRDDQLQRQYAGSAG